MCDPDIPGEFTFELDVPAGDVWIEFESNVVWEDDTGDSDSDQIFGNMVVDMGALLDGTQVTLACGSEGLIFDWDDVDLDELFAPLLPNFTFSVPFGPTIAVTSLLDTDGLFELLEDTEESFLGEFPELLSTVVEVDAPEGAIVERGTGCFDISLDNLLDDFLDNEGDPGALCTITNTIVEEDNGEDPNGEDPNGEDPNGAEDPTIITIEDLIDIFNQLLANIEVSNEVLNNLLNALEAAFDLEQELDNENINEIIQDLINVLELELGIDLDNDNINDLVNDVVNENDNEVDNEVVSTLASEIVNRVSNALANEVNVENSVENKVENELDNKLNNEIDNENISNNENNNANEQNQNQTNDQNQSSDQPVNVSTGDVNIGGEE